MAHEWERYGEDRERPFQRLRRCLKCGATQEWCDEQRWGRVIGYKWWPLVGRCPADRRKRSGAK